MEPYFPQCTCVYFQRDCPFGTRFGGASGTTARRNAGNFGATKCWSCARCKMSTFRSWTPAVALTHLGNGDLVGRVHEARRIVVYVRHPNNDGNGALLARGPGGAGDLKRDGRTWKVDDTLQWKVLPENGLHTWKTMWLRFSSSRSRGCRSCSDHLRSISVCAHICTYVGTRRRCIIDARESLYHSRALVIWRH